MIKRFWVSLLLLALWGSVLASQAVQAFYHPYYEKHFQTFEATIDMHLGTDSLYFAKMSLGDTLILTLKNPSHEPLVFKTLENLGNQQLLTISPQSEETVRFRYTRTFSHEMRYAVTHVLPPKKSSTATTDNTSQSSPSPSATSGAK